MNQSSPEQGVIARHRLEAFSDGIYAVAVTLLVLELRVPELPTGADDAALVGAVAHLLPKVITWLLSFYVIAIFWIAQQRFLRQVAVVSNSLAWLELLQLSLISLFPFSNALMVQYGGRVPSAVIYAGHLLAIALVSWWRTAHFLRRPALQEPAMPREVPRALRIRAWTLNGCAALAVALAFVIPGWNMVAMLPTLLLGRYARA